MRKNKNHGFTLIELSIVLVIIGLVLGGIVAGKDMIRAAELRALISQKDKFTAAVNTFKIKYNAIPGDIKVADAARFGFFTFTGSYAGWDSYLGDGGGLVMGNWPVETTCAYECGAFWRHLSDAKLIEGSYGATLKSDTDTDVCGFGIDVGIPAGECHPTTQSLYMPKAKLGGAYWGAKSLLDSDHFANWDGTPFVSGVDLNKNIFYLAPDSLFSPLVSAIDAYGLDSKIDDGKPNSGKFLVSVYNADTGTPYFSTTVNANSNACTYGGVDEFDTANQYNVNKNTGGEKLTCIPIFVW